VSEYTKKQYDCVSPPAYPELVQGGEAETLGVFHNHTGGVGHIDPHLNHAGGYQNLNFAQPESLHDAPLLLLVEF
jgi:hypothetical protein